MTISYSDCANNQVRILSEHKISADLTSYQQSAYFDWQPDALVLVAPAVDIAAYARLGNFGKCVSWLDVALAIARIGDASGGPEWRTTALDPDAPSRLRVLLETLSFIERQNVGVCPLHPMNADDIDIYRRIRDSG
jgi:hypothetical protein